MGEEIECPRPLIKHDEDGTIRSYTRYTVVNCQDIGSVEESRDFVKGLPVYSRLRVDPEHGGGNDGEISESDLSPTARIIFGLNTRENLELALALDGGNVRIESTGE